MSIKPNTSGQYTAKANEILYTQDSLTTTILLLLKGKVNILLSPDNSEQKDFEARLYSLDGNTFLGINDVFTEGKTTVTLKAEEPSIFYCFPASCVDDAKKLLASQKDYSAYMMSSLATLIDYSYTAYQKLYTIYSDLKYLSDTMLIYYLALKDKYYFKYSILHPSMNDIANRYGIMKKKGQTFFPIESDVLIKPLSSDENASLPEADLPDIEYFIHLLNISVDSRKAFFSSDNYVCEYHLKKGSEKLCSILSATRYILKSIQSDISLLYQQSENLFSAYSMISLELVNDKEAARSAIGILENGIKVFTKNITRLQNEFDCLYSIKTDNLPDMLQNIINSVGLSQTTSEDSDELPSELNNSLENILAYCSFPEDKTNIFLRNMGMFRSLKDKSSSAPEIRELRAAITADFFDLYSIALHKALQSSSIPKYIRMFLNYGFMDEKLLTNEQVFTLYRMCEKKYDSGRFDVSTCTQWFDKVYKMEKDPSINEFGLDYFDNFREMKKRKQVSDQDKPDYDNDTLGRLQFEINSMLKPNQKICHGHISSYFPILHKDMITRDLEKCAVTPDRISAALERLLNIDYSAFYREVWFRVGQPQISMDRTPIMKEVLPDIIIVPTFGARGSMWQELSGKARNTPGRFILPAFCDEDLNDIILKLVGNFRWELCRTMMGAAWNDVTEKSLTSEYSDYIQFIKNNKDLSEDVKEKIKVQCAKFRNVVRDIFTNDYESYINSESTGILRLNKVARSIVFRYCPFSRPIRENLAKQPAYSELVLQMTNQRAKYGKLLESKYNKAFNPDNRDIEMEDTITFYKDL